MAQILKRGAITLSNLALIVLLSGCTLASRIENAPRPSGSVPAIVETYSVANGVRRRFNDGDTSILLAFSGGGARAAALSYGVMRKLRDTKSSQVGDDRRLLDNVDIISSVSGGSFTAAYYGLFGERLFEDFEHKFLRRDVQGVLTQRFLSPIRIFSGIDRSDMAVNYYDELLFENKNFSDLNRQGAPLILINATDLSYGLRFSFVDEYFSLMCSDINSFSVARAVAASSAIPILFSPIVLRNYAGCDHKLPHWLTPSDSDLGQDLEIQFSHTGFRSYLNYKERTFVHLADGGISDNLGLRAYIDFLTYSGGGLKIIKEHNGIAPKRVALILVNADSKTKFNMDLSEQPPSFAEIIESMTASQLRRYNAATINKMRDIMEGWSKNAENPDGIDVYLIEVNLNDVTNEAILEKLNAIPTSFTLQEEDVDMLIQAGEDLLQHNELFKQFVNTLN